eukprot:scaffold2782_cov182-Amphora_coffeaeformis.AAC.10
MTRTSGGGCFLFGRESPLAKLHVLYGVVVLLAVGTASAFTPPQSSVGRVIRQPCAVSIHHLQSSSPRKTTRLFIKAPVKSGTNATAVTEEVSDTDSSSTSSSPQQSTSSDNDGAPTATSSSTRTNDEQISVSSHGNPITEWLEKNVFLGIKFTPEVAAIVTVYFVQGALGLARLAKTYLLKDELSLGPAELGALTGAFALPWTIKPLYGFLTDGFPLFGYRRKTYLMAAGVLGSLSYGILSWSVFWDGLPTNVAITGTVVTILLGSACVAMSDVVTDGIVVTRTRESKDPAVAGGLQSLCWGASATGSILSAYFSGSLLETMSVRSVFGLTALLPLLVALIAIQVDEKPVATRTNGTASQGVASLEIESSDEATFVPGGIKAQATALWDAFRQDSIWKPALFIFLWQSTPTADGAFFFFLSNDMGLGPEFMGRVSLISAVASLGGVVVYNQFLKRVPIKDILYWATIVSVPLGLVPVLLVTHVNQALGIPDQALIYGDDVVLAALGEIAFLPTLVLAARLCPPGYVRQIFSRSQPYYFASHHVLLDRPQQY